MEYAKNTTTRSMNCTELFLKQVSQKPNQMALWIPGKESVTFRELHDASARAQSLFLSYGAGPGSSVLVLDQLGVRLYAAISALLALGATVILVEPWMPIERIERVIQLSKPKMFFSNTMGMLWGSRVKAIREIPHWIRASRIGSSAPRREMILEKVSETTPGILTFTSGTTGSPKGVVRTQGYLVKQHEVLSQHLEAEHFTGPDLCIFANFALSNLASGRGTVVIPPSWSSRSLKALDELPTSHQPVTLTSGPAFLRKLMQNSQTKSLKSIHIGGALTDCALFERAFQYWPDAHWGHIYGGSEVEPVAVTDARLAVEESRKRGFFQTLYLGKNVAQIRPKLESDSLWVAGPHVCPEYLGNDQENQIYKRKDNDGVLWHSMGDRIQAEPSGWWYMGRSGQRIEEFQLEQKIYSHLQSSKSFIYSKSGTKGEVGKVERWLIGEGVKARKNEIIAAFPAIDGVCEARIYRDRRHRARIDRRKTLEKGASWLM